MSGQEWQAKSVFCDNAPNRIKVFVAGWKGKQIADCGVETPDTKADAQLLASAPELLAALEWTLREFAHFAPKDLALNICRENAQAAIRKARGIETK